MRVSDIFVTASVDVLGQAVTAHVHKLLFEWACAQLVW